MTLLISLAATQLIIACEVTSQAVYTATLQAPTWPGGSSGITIGIGYDLGYETVDQLAADWRDLLDVRTLDRLAECAGLTGAKAQAALPSLSGIRIPYGAALSVFETENIPRYSLMTEHAFPACDKLSTDSFGALVSLVFNRGPGMTDAPGDTQQRRREMRQIRDAMACGDFADVPGYLRAMKRLWTNGLVARREAEAALFEKGLAA